uniref:MOSC domain-containing protein n=1 Tax=Steinernema glaseri TaxID=37863 RepID=A0A1I7YYK5_9BILA
MSSDIPGRPYLKIGLTVASAALITFPIYQCLRRAYFEWRYPWIQVGTVEDLYVYPVKSCKGNKVKKLQCGKLGASSGENFDRFFLVIDDETNHFYTARQMPKLVLLEAHVENNTLHLQSPDGDYVDIDLQSVVSKGTVRPSTLHYKERQDGLDCGDEAASFITKYLDMGDKLCRLVYYQEGLHSDRRLVTSQQWWNNPVPKRVDDHAFVDYAPYHAFSLASVEHLNAQLQESGAALVSYKNFRPNIVVSGPPPYDEDRWMQLRIGGTEFICYRPCDRCTIPTVNPETGIRNPDNQPLKKLREYRLAPLGKMRKEFKQSPIFGVIMGILKSGEVSVGDAVFVRYKATPF